MEIEESENLMTEGTIWKKIIFFAFPLFLGNLFQQLYNTTDSSIVGNLLGSNALAAVSSSGNLIFLMTGFFNGAAIGAEVVIARHFGARGIDNMQRAIHIIVTFGLISSLVLTILGVLLAPRILIWIDTPANVLPQSATYFRIYFMGSLGLVMYSIFTGVLQTVGNSRYPLDYLVISSIINIVLDIILVVVFHMGVGSAALTTILSQFVSAFLCMNRLLRTKDSYWLSLRKIHFHRNMLALIVRYGLPSDPQNSIIIAANVVVQPNINDFGEMAVAGCGVYSKIEGFAFLPITSFTMTLTTFVGQNLGACQYERTKEGARFGMLCSVAITEVIGIVTSLGAPLLTAASNNDPQVIIFGTEKARASVVLFFLLAYSHCISAILYGTRRSMVPVVVILLFWCVVQVIFLTVMAHFLSNITVVYWVYPLTWSLSSIAFFLYYRKVNWMHAFEAA